MIAKLLIQKAVTFLLKQPRITVSATPPINPRINDLWLDIS